MFIFLFILVYFALAALTAIFIARDDKNFAVGEAAILGFGWPFFWCVWIASQIMKWYTKFILYMSGRDD